MECGAQEALDKRNKGEEPLLIEEDQLLSKLEAVLAQIEENKVHKKKLEAVIANCHRMKQLPPGNKATSFVRENLNRRT